MKKLVLFSLVSSLFLCGCQRNDPNHFTMAAGTDDTSYLANIDICPKAHLRQNDIKITQFEADQPLFDIRLIGYDGYCYFNEKTNKHKAVLKPRFQITRLSDSDVTDIHFSYYLETVEGPAKYIGKKTFFETLSIAEGQTDLTYTGANREIIIPEPGTYNLDIYIGLYAHLTDSEFKS
jgi:major membrane immunogen (membrane-anchored lipoprotein)